jgi:hypothetical protein
MSRTPAHQKLMMEKWNAAHPVGTEVLVRRDVGEPMRTRTRSEAWMLGASCRDIGHTAVVMVEGITGGYSLERVAPVEPQDAAPQQVEGRTQP